jgi:drug/metabolite transporter (DMT)-like permease
MMVAKVVTLAGLILVVFGNEAHAYLDFSIGNFLLQGALASLAGAAVLVRHSWAHVKGLTSSVIHRTLLRKSAGSKKQRPPTQLHGPKE